MSAVPASYDFAAERMLAALASALELHGLGPQVGLLDPAMFPQHKGGTGILVCCDHAARGTAAWLLEQMGCAVRDHELGVEAHLRGELLPAPPLPPVHVRSADSCSVAELAAVTAVKRCNGPCGQVLPLDSFSLNGRSPLGKQRRMHFCRPCDAARQDDIRRRKAPLDSGTAEAARSALLR